MTMPPMLTPLMQELVDKSDDMAELMRVERRALAISLPDEAVLATQKFQRELDDLSLAYRIFVVHKATDRTHVVKRLTRELGVGVDVASLGELEAALACGINPADIIVTGPKSTRLLERAVEVRCRAIVIDSLGELERLLVIESTELPEVLLRLSRTMTNMPGITKVGRFGLDMAGYKSALALLRDTHRVTLRGLAFHLDSIDVNEKSYAIKVALGLLSELSLDGFDATVLDIGGGYGASYGLSPELVSQFETTIRRDLQENQLDTWQQTAFGFKKQADGSITGNWNGMDIPVSPNGPDRVRALFEANYDGSTLSEQVNERLIEIWCEPGSAIFTNAGVVATEIIDSSERDGVGAVVTNASYMQLQFDGNEVPIDPVFIPRTKDENGDTYAAYIHGQLCMERDVLSRRLMSFSQRPQPGDLLLWPYTGAYRMHMSQSNAIMHPDLARYRYEQGKLIKDEV